MFAEQVKPFIIPGKKYSFAIDLTDDPYKTLKNTFKAVINIVKK
jgi:hypothetical protein